MLIIKFIAKRMAEFVVVLLMLIIAIVIGFSIGMAVDKLVGAQDRPPKPLVGDEWAFVPFELEVQPKTADFQEQVQYSIDSHDVQPNHKQLQPAISVYKSENL